MNIDSIKFAVDSGFDIVSFTSVGYLCGRSLTWLSDSSTKTAVIKKIALPNLTSATVCCTLFIMIDRFVHNLLKTYFSGIKQDPLSRFFAGDEIHKPIYSTLRIGASMLVAIGLFNLFSSPLDLVSINTSTGCAIISLAIVVNNLILTNFAVFNHRP